VVIAVSVSAGGGIVGFLIALGVCVAAGVAMGLIGNRYPMIYRQNRRDRRRRSGLPEQDDTTRTY
jgi:hypothetical protein